MKPFFIILCLVILIYAIIGKESKQKQTFKLYAPAYTEETKQEQPIVHSEDDIINRLLIAHNEQRAKYNKLPLTINEKLNSAARKHSDWMTTHRMSHDEGFITPFKRLSLEDYKFSRGGENIAMGQSTVEEVMKDWMDSPGHKANILGNFTEVGFGVSKSNKGKLYWTADFGTPMKTVYRSVFKFRRK